MSRSWGIGVVVSFAVAALMGGSLVFWLQNPQLVQAQAEVQRLSETLLETESDLEESEGYGEDLDALTQENATLSQTNEKLESDYKKLESDNTTLNHNFDSLQAAVLALEAARDRTEQDLAWCRTILSGARDSGKKLESAYDDVRQAAGIFSVTL